jgi:hypothetical protein
MSIKYQRGRFNILKNVLGFEGVPLVTYEDEHETTYTYLNKSIVPWADVRIAVTHYKSEFPPELERQHTIHTHQVAETYAVLGDLTMEIDVAEEKHLISSPGILVIPPGVKRHRKYVKGTGFVIVIHRIPEEAKKAGWPEE